LLIADMIHSCFKRQCRRSAVCSIGGAFAEAVATVAVKNGMDVGRFVAIIMQDFGRRANDSIIATLQQNVAGCGSSRC